jgi:hypothetical protein
MADKTEQSKKRTMRKRTAKPKTGWQASSKKRKNEKVRLPPDLLEVVDPHGFSTGTRAITLNLPIDLWEQVDRLVPSRGKNKFFIALLRRFLKEQRL